MLRTLITNMALYIVFRYLKSDGMIKSRCTDPFILPDGSPSYVIYDRKMISHPSCPPSKVRIT